MSSLGPARIVQKVEDLPEVPEGTKILYMDYETNSFDPKRGGNMPYLGDRIGGIALTWDDHEAAYYIPYRHNDVGMLFPNLPLEPVVAWLKRVCEVPTWVNHNIKFDAHFLVQEGIIYEGELIDTYVIARLIDTDRFRWGLKVLQKDWLQLAVDEVDVLKSWLKQAKTKNYVDAPVDICGEYACTDVLSNRMLYHWMMDRYPEDMQQLLATEIKMTSVLFDLERDGMLIDKTEVKVETFRSLKKCIEHAENLETATEWPYVDSSQHNFDVLINQLGLPILKWNYDKKTKQRGGPSFDKEALALYSIHPDVTCDGDIQKVVQWIAEYRSEAHFKALFLENYTRLSDGLGLLHSNYNQIVRTGRMSCSNPNSQQLNDRARRLIHPGEGEAFLSFDASQIEFRLIIHYIQDKAAISAYLEDPLTDFHQWVADLCRIKRKPAKNVNFAMGYGAGKKKVVSMLRQNPDVMAEVSTLVNELVEKGEVAPGERDRTFRRLCQEKAEQIYHTYHDRLPGIRSTTQKSAEICRLRGYVFNAYRRRRHLPRSHAHKAFNSVIQGCAMDIIKERMVALSPRFNSRIREWGIRIVANVHDEVLFAGPIEIMRRSDVQAYILETLESPSVLFRVPIMWDAGFSEVNWYEAAKEEKQMFKSGVCGGKIDTASLRTWEPRVAA